MTSPTTPQLLPMAIVALVIIALLWRLARRVIRSVVARRELSALRRQHIALEPSRITGKPARAER